MRALSYKCLPCVGLDGGLRALWRRAWGHSPHQLRVVTGWGHSPHSLGDQLARFFCQAVTPAERAGVLFWGLVLLPCFASGGQGALLPSQRALA